MTGVSVSSGISVCPVPVPTSMLSEYTLRPTSLPLCDRSMFHLSSCMVGKESHQTHHTRRRLAEISSHTGIGGIGAESERVTHSPFLFFSSSPFIFTSHPSPSLFVRWVVVLYATSTTFPVQIDIPDEQLEPDLFPECRSVAILRLYTSSLTCLASAPSLTTSQVPTRHSP